MQAGYLIPHRMYLRSKKQKLLMHHDHAMITYIQIFNCDICTCDHIYSAFPIIHSDLFFRSARLRMKLIVTCALNWSMHCVSTTDRFWHWSSPQRLDLNDEFEFIFFDQPIDSWTEHWPDILARIQCSMGYWYLIECSFNMHVFITIVFTKNRCRPVFHF